MTSFTFTSEDVLRLTVENLTLFESALKQFGPSFGQVAETPVEPLMRSLVLRIGVSTGQTEEELKDRVYHDSDRPDSYQVYLHGLRLKFVPRFLAALEDVFGYTSEGKGRIRARITSGKPTRHEGEKHVTSKWKSAVSVRRQKDVPKKRPKWDVVALEKPTEEEYSVSEPAYY